MNANKIIYSTDVDLLQSNFIVFEDNQCLWVDIDEDSNKVLIYRFDLLKESESWTNLKDINNSCDTNYTNEISDFIQFTQDVCWYYGAVNLDSTPDEMNFEEFELYINLL